MSAENFKFRDIKTYCSTEWLANNTKKYRSVFDEQEIAYLYCEVSLFNKQFDNKVWKLQMQLKCFDQENNEICDLNCDREVDTSDTITYIREGWGVKTPGAYWFSQFLYGCQQGRIQPVACMPYLIGFSTVFKDALIHPSVIIAQQ